MGAGAQQVTEVAGQGAHVGAGTTLRLRRTAPGGRRRRGRCPTMSKRSTRTGRATRSITSPSRAIVVEPPPFDLEGRHHRRDLGDVAEQVLSDHGAGIVDGDLDRSCVTVTTPSASSVSVSTPMTTLSRVPLASVGDEAEQARHRSDTHDEHAGGTGIERAGVADAPLIEPAAQLGDDVVTRDPGRFVDDRHAVHRRRPPPSHRARPSCLSVWKSSSDSSEEAPADERPGAACVAGRTLTIGRRRISSMRSAARITSSGRKSSIGVFFARICRLIDGLQSVAGAARALR